MTNFLLDHGAPRWFDTFFFAYAQKTTHHDREKIRALGMKLRIKFRLIMVSGFEPFGEKLYRTINALSKQ